MLGITVKTGPWSELQEYCRTVRLSVFVEEQLVPSTLELDGTDNNHHHVVILMIATTPSPPHGWLKMANWEECRC